MSLQTRKELLFRMRSRYQQADREEKSKILSGFIAATGYHRKYAAAILAAHPQAHISRERKYRRLYDDTVRQALVVIWNAAGQICSKRLAPFMTDFVETLERFGHLSLNEDVRRKLLTMSAASMDRLLKNERSRHPRGVSTTRPGNLLKQRIKVRTFGQWDDAVPGFFEADLVAHCGDRADGPFINSLVMTDISTGWIEFIPLLRKCDSDVIAGLEAIKSVLPVPIMGLDTDNGCEFINHTLLKYCESNQITFTRSRVYKKNDQAHVEQKNGSVIRRIVGYERFEGIEGVTHLLALYKMLRLYVNFFQPSCKLIRKTRTGSKISKEYDSAKTPAQRMLDSNLVTAETKRKLVQMRDELDPVLLFEQIGKLQEELFSAAVMDIRTPLESKMRKSEPTSVEEPAAMISKRLLDLKAARTTKRKYTARVRHTWRTRIDPLQGTYEFAKLQFALHPEITSPQLLMKLKKQFPEQVTGKELKTLQRRLSKWRRDALHMRISTYTADTTYDDLPFNASLQVLTEKALKIAPQSG